MNIEKLNDRDFGRMGAILSQPFDKRVYEACEVAVRRQSNPADPSGNTWTERKIYYDTYSQGVATLTVGQVANMFQRQVGGVVTLAQTNMRGQGMIANGNLYTIKQFGVYVTANSLNADVNNILEGMTVSLQIQGVVYAEGKISIYPGGRGAVVGGAAMPAAIGTQAVISGVTNGVADIRNVFTFAAGIPILQLQTIAVLLTSEGAGFTTASAANGGSGFTITVFVDGFESRRTM